MILKALANCTCTILYKNLFEKKLIIINILKPFGFFVHPVYLAVLSDHIRK